MRHSPFVQFLKDWYALLLVLLAAGGLYVWYSLPQDFGLAEGFASETETVVCIDPGHPTKFNSGRTLQHGVTELDMNWEVALKLESILRNQYGVKPVMTRYEKDKLMSNPDRARVANKHKAALFIRLHCDAGPGKGFTVYYPDRQGEDLGIKGPSQEVIKNSRTAAYLIHSGMASVLEGLLDDRGVKGERYTLVGRRQGALTGSIFSESPTVTVEMVFLSNADDAAFISSEWGQQDMARALANGVMCYLNSLEGEH